MASLYKKPVFIRDPKSGQRTKTKSRKWWGRYCDSSGRERRVPLAIDRAAAQTLLNKLVRKAEREKAGLIDPSDEHLKKPIAEHIKDYTRYLQAKGNAKRYVEIATARVEAIAKACRFRGIGDVAPSPVANWLRTQRETNQFGMSTSNDYLIAIKAFCNWLVREMRMIRNPLAHLQRLNARLDVRHARRVLTPDELQRLVATAATNKCRLGAIPNRDRTVLYQVAAFTGLRAQELASLTPQSFDLAATPPTVQVEACYSKHRRTDILPLQAKLVTVLNKYLSERAPGHPRKNPENRLWPGRWYRKAGRMLQRDLKAAREVWLKEAPTKADRKEREKSDFLKAVDSAGRIVDFHALRHGFITYLVTANVPPKVAQLLARHSTITLTMDRYTHLGIVDLAAGLESLPNIENDQAKKGKSASEKSDVA